MVKLLFYPTAVYQKVLKRGVDALDRGARKYGVGSDRFSSLLCMVCRSLNREENSLIERGFGNVFDDEVNSSLISRVVNYEHENMIKHWGMV